MPNEPEPRATPRFVSLTPSPDAPLTERFPSGLPELDRVLGPGGWVRGAVYLFSGDPGAGKSTLLLAAAAAVASAHPPIVLRDWCEEHNRGNLTTTDGLCPDCERRRSPPTPVAYLTAEEAAPQIQARAERLGVATAPVRLAETDDLSLLADPTFTASFTRGLVVVDSAQRFYDPTIDAEPGTIRQVRAAARRLVAFARATQSTVAVICHETKGGRAAGPNSLFHDVDAVLHLSAPTPDLRVLTAKKNRYAPTDAVGLFRMTPRGLIGLTERPNGAAR